MSGARRARPRARGGAVRRRGADERRSDGRHISAGRPRAMSREAMPGCGLLRAAGRAPGRARRALALRDRARPRAHPAPRARGGAPPEPRGDRGAGDRRLPRARQPRRDRGDPRGADLARHARRADGGRLGARRGAARGAGAPGDLRHHPRIPRPFRPHIAQGPARDRRAQGRRPARSGRGRFEALATAIATKPRQLQAGNEAVRSP